MSNIKFEKGVSLFLALIVMAILLAIALGLSHIIITQIRMAKGMGDSVVAFNAADTGIERALVNRHNPTNLPLTTLPNGATYQVFVTASGTGGCSAPNFCIKSVGSYRGVKRAIEITY